MVVFWKELEGKHLLCVEPASRLLTMCCLAEGHWTFECLGSKKSAQCSGIEDAKQMAYVFLEGIMREVHSALEGL